MKNLTFTHSFRQLFLALAGFVVAVALIESDGLANWADRLQPGPLRTVAVPAANTLQKSVQPLGISTVRERALDEAARIGWTDDAVRLARGAKAAAPAQMAACGVPPSATPDLTAAAIAPLAASVPRSTTLAPLAPVEQGKPRVVALAGDSMMAVGLSATFMRQAAQPSNSWR